MSWLANCVSTNWNVSLDNFYLFFFLLFFQRICWWSMIATPFIIFYLAGLIFTADTLYIIKIFLLACLYAVSHTIGRLFFNEKLMSLLPLSVYMATKLWFYITWFIYIMPTVSPLTTCAFLVCSSVLWICFLKCWRGDPGVIKLTQDLRLKVI